MKIATHQCLFSQDKWLFKNLENIYSHVDKIYLSISQIPWNYNHHFRHEYENETNLDQIRSSKYIDKIEIIEGIWDNETDQRNACLDRAKDDGFDYLLIIDTDEFYKKPELSLITQFIEQNPSYDLYKCGWISFWKDSRHIVVDASGNHIVGYPPIAINIGNGVRFRDRRNANFTTSITIPDVVCYHMSFALSDDECLRKLKTWGHSHEVNINGWFESIWKSWHVDSENLHPVDPPAWKRAVKFNDLLPMEIIEPMNYTEFYEAVGMPQSDVNHYLSCSLYEGYPVEHGGAVWTQEGKSIYCLIRHFKPSRILELGNFKGSSTNHILQAVHDNGHGSVTLVDIEDRLEYDRLFNRNFIRIVDDSLKFLASDIDYDFIIIDDCHEYAHVKQELLLIYKNNQCPAYNIWLHDYFATESDGVGVKKAWDETELPSQQNTYKVLGPESNCGFLFARHIRK